MQEEIIEKCNEIRDLLVKKNESYGNAVFERGILFDIEPVQAIKARINDKMNRIINQKSFEDENDIQDLTGYLILLQVAMEEKKEKWKDEIIGDCTELPESFKYVKG